MAALAVAPVAADARRGSIYDVTKASGFERLTFSGDSDASCEQVAVCGYSGTVTYTIGGKPKGTIVLTRTKAGRVSGNARYRAGGTTRANVTQGTSCTDTVAHKTDVFELTSSGPRLDSLLLTYHPTGDDYLDTQCAGPNEDDVAAAGALPEGIFRARDFFRAERPGFTLGGGTPFKSGGFNASVEWKLKFKAKQRGCSPSCRIPPGR